MAAPTTDAARTVTVSRTIDASPDDLYDAFLDPEDLAGWTPPTGFSAEVHALDPVEGGTFRMTFTGETEETAAMGSTFHGTYVELVPGEKIVNTDQFETDDPDLAGEIRTTVTFEAVDVGAEVTVVQEGLPAAIPVEDAEAGWADSLGKLVALVELA